jgi:hypothetical protein
MLSLYTPVVIGASAIKSLVINSGQSNSELYITAVNTFPLNFTAYYAYMKTATSTTLNTWNTLDNIFTWVHQQSIGDNRFSYAVFDLSESYIIVNQSTLNYTVKNTIGASQDMIIYFLDADFNFNQALASDCGISGIETTNCIKYLTIKHGLSYDKKNIVYNSTNSFSVKYIVFSFVRATSSTTNISITNITLSNVYNDNNTLPQYTLEYNPNICYNETTGIAILDYNITATDMEGDQIFYSVTNNSYANKIINIQNDLIVSDQYANAKPDYSLFASKDYYSLATHNVENIYVSSAFSNTYGCFNQVLETSPYSITYGRLITYENSPFYQLLPSFNLAGNVTFTAYMEIPKPDTKYIMRVLNSFTQDKFKVIFNLSAYNNITAVLSLNNTEYPIINTYYDHSLIGYNNIKTEYYNTGNDNNITIAVYDYYNNVISSASILFTVNNSGLLYGVEYLPINTFGNVSGCFLGSYSNSLKSFILNKYTFYQDKIDFTPEYKTTYNNQLPALFYGTYYVNVFVTDNAHPNSVSNYKQIVYTVSTNCDSQLINAPLETNTQRGKVSGLISLFNNLFKGLHSLGSWDILTAAFPLFMFICFIIILWNTHDILNSLLFSMLICLMLSVFVLQSLSYSIISSILMIIGSLPHLSKMFFNSGGGGSSD